MNETIGTQIGTQVKLPLSMAVQIVLQGIRIRLGRAVVTVSSVVLGIAFLMSVRTGQIIQTAVAAEEELRQNSTLMLSLVKAEVGTIPEKNLALAVCGKLSPQEQAFLGALVRERPKSLRSSGWQHQGVQSVAAKEVGQGADVLMILGDGECEAPLAELTAGLNQPVFLDSKADRQYAGFVPAGLRKELFFGQQIEEEAKKRKDKEEADKRRTAWILSVALLVTVICITNALLMSVTERFREIGTMKCLGALSAFIRRIFLIESALIGFAGSVVGVLAGILIPVIGYGLTFGFGTVVGSLQWGVLLQWSFFGLVAGTALAVIAGIYPAGFAARMVPASALRSNV